MQAGYQLFAYPGVRDNRSTLNTKTGYDDDDCGRGSLFNCMWLKLFSEKFDMS